MVAPTDVQMSSGRHQFECMNMNIRTCLVRCGSLSNIIATLWISALGCNATPANNASRLFLLKCLHSKPLIEPCRRSYYQLHKRNPENARVN